MKKLFLITAAVFALFTAQSQCVTRHWGPTEWKSIIKEEWDDNQSILMRKYMSNDDEFITVNYVEKFSFSDKDGVVSYKDRSMNVVGEYTDIDECIWTYGDDEEYVMYIKTYTLTSKSGKVSTFIVRSSNPSYRNISSVIIKTRNGFVASQIF